MSLRCYVQAAYFYEQESVFIGNVVLRPKGVVEFSCRHHGEKRQPYNILSVCILDYCATQFLLVYTSTHSAMQSLSLRLLCVCDMCAQNSKLLCWQKTT